ncbi:DUF2141 domain-containing protein [Alteromonas sp. 14N.309.X.WAT.G.H12]|uniref:DUF2141 domain-containing protein n=1 Tax=Alteromonas sp. 14N.309.X.WAT.G.H12 TaxID=3120824 RepID=UPI002FD06BA6
MKTHLSALTLLTLTTPVAIAADVTVNFAGLNQLSGELYIAVYPSEETMQSHRAIQSQIVSVHKKGQKAVLADLPSGHYGIMVFQDLDKNRDLNTNLLGIPTEPYGFSANPNIMGPPVFADIQFEVSSAPVQLTINME